MIIRNNFGINPVIGKEQNQQKQVERSKTTGDKSFQSILQDKLNKDVDLKFSKHAKVRLESRNIELTQQQNERLGKGVKKAEEKGVKDSLILCDNLAFLVSVENKTVVTALNGQELKDNVFTNIDGAVIV